MAPYLVNNNLIYFHGCFSVAVGLLATNTRPSVVEVSNSDALGCSVFSVCFLNWFLSMTVTSGKKTLKNTASQNI